VFETVDAVISEPVLSASNSQPLSNDEQPSSTLGDEPAPIPVAMHGPSNGFQVFTPAKLTQPVDDTDSFTNPTNTSPEETISTSPEPGMPGAVSAIPGVIAR
jgi:hypothetical protein